MSYFIRYNFVSFPQVDFYIRIALSNGNTPIEVELLSLGSWRIKRNADEFLETSITKLRSLLVLVSSILRLIVNLNVNKARQ